MKAEPHTRPADEPRPGGSTARIYLARHGRTALNAAGALRGRLDPPLDAVGRREAEQLATAVGNRGVRLVVSSPLSRALETAWAVASRAGIAVEVDPRLIDRDYGPWAGQPKEAVVAQWGSIDQAPDVEPASEVRERAWRALADLADRVHGSTAVAVSHDAVMRLALVTIDAGLGDPDRLVLETGCFNHLEYQAGRWTVASVNEVPSATADEVGTDGHT